MVSPPPSNVVLVVRPSLDLIEKLGKGVDLVNCVILLQSPVKLIELVVVFSDFTQIHYKLSDNLRLATLLFDSVFQRLLVYGIFALIDKVESMSHCDSISSPVHAFDVQRDLLEQGLQFLRAGHRLFIVIKCLQCRK